MSGLLLAAAGLAVAGFDPGGALLLGAALAAGASRRAGVVFGVVVLLGTAALGTVLSLLLGTSVQDVDWLDLLPDGPVAAVVEAVVAALLVVWAVLRIRRRAVPREKARRARPDTGSLTLLGLGWAAVALLDPSCIAVIVLAGRGDSIGEVALAHVLWSVLSQSPLAVLTVAVALGAHERVVRWIERWWQRARPLVRHLVTGALLVLAALLLTDVGFYVVTGEFLIG